MQLLRFVLLSTGIALMEFLNCWRFPPTLGVLACRGVLCVFMAPLRAFEPEDGFTAC